MSSNLQSVFIVEDEVLVALEMADMLEEFGFTVIGPAVHQEQAIELAREEQIDAAFLDVNLNQGKTSEPVAMILRERGVPFIFVTAYTENQVTFRTSDELVLRKPITSSDLLAALRKFHPDYERG